MFTDPATGQKASRLVYLSDEETLAYQLHIRGGKLMITNVTVDILKNKAFVKMKATSLLKADDQKGMNFNIVSKDSLPAITAIAGRVRAALTDYEARFKGFKGIFTSQTKTSRDALEILKGIRDDETLVKEVQFLLYSFVRDYWPDVRPIASPLGTPPTQRFPRHGTGDLRDRLVAAIEPLLGPETKRNP